MESKTARSVSPKDPLPSGVDVINTLPNEVLLKIFGYLDSEDSLRNVSKVSQRFEILSKDSSLIRKIAIHNARNEDLADFGVDVLKRSKNLIELQFVNCVEPYVANIVTIAINQCPKLKVIGITDPENDKFIYDSTLLYIIEHGKNIESLSVDGPDIVNQILIYPETFGKLKNLRKLSFTPVRPNQDILKALTNSCENLEELTCWGYPEGQEYLFKLLEKFRCTLKYFELYSNPFNPPFTADNDYPDFHGLLGKCKNMESLNIDGNFLDFPEDIETFISAISNMKNLTRLEVDAGPDNDESLSITKIFNSGHLKNLKEFKLISNDLKGESAKHRIIELIKAIDTGCPNLKVLNLTNLIAIEFDKGRFVFCKVCHIYHLKDQPYYRKSNCPYKEKNFMKTACSWLMKE